MGRGGREGFFFYFNFIGLIFVIFINVRRVMYVFGFRILSRM